MTDQELRDTLSSALQARDLDGAESVMSRPAFASLSPAEQAFYRGVAAWLRGHLDEAATLLPRAAEEERCRAGALKCLAEVQLARRDVAQAMSALERILEAAPDDERSYIRLVHAAVVQRGDDALTWARAVRDREAVSERGAILLGRVLLGAALRELAAGPPPEEPSRPDEADVRARAARTKRARVAELAESAARVLDRAQDTAQRSWCQWLCQVLAREPAAWGAAADGLLDARPSSDRGAPPAEARWVEALLKTLSRQLDAALDGARVLVEMAGAPAPAAARRDAAAALWRVARRAETPSDYERLGQCVKRFVEQGGVAEHVAALRAAAAWRSLEEAGSIGEADRRLVEAELSAEERLLGRGLWHLARGETWDTQALAETDPAGASEQAPWLAVIGGLCALARGDGDAFRDARSRSGQGATAGRWAVLDTASRVRFRQPDAVRAVREVLLAITAVGSRADHPLPLSGLLAYLATESGREDAADVLGRLEPEHLAADDEAPSVYLRAAALAGLEEQAQRLLERCPALAARARDDLAAVCGAAAARAIEAGDYQAASEWLAKTRPET